MVNTNWLSLFPQSFVDFLPIVGSDHSPILFSTSGRFSVRRRPKRFEAMWLTDPSCFDVVRNEWNMNENGSLAYVVAKKINNTMNSLIKWQNEHFGKFQRHINELNLELTSIQTALNGSSDLALLKREGEVRSELEMWLEREEIQWAQRAHQLWLVSGDRNTKYFHIVVQKRRLSKKITKLLSENGEWIDN